MKNRKRSISAMLVLMAAPLSLAGSLAIAAPMTPEMAAKKEMVRKQQEQRLTPEKQKAAAEALKAERRKVYEANKATQKQNQ